MTEDSDVIILKDESGEEKKFEILDIIEKDDVEYAVMLPEDSEDEVVIFKVDILNDESDEAQYVEVEDEELAEQIFNEFVKRVDGEDEENQVDKN